MESRLGIQKKIKAASNIFNFLNVDLDTQDYQKIKINLYLKIEKKKKRIAIHMDKFFACHSVLVGVVLCMCEMCDISKLQSKFF
jgi:hypothetical protein